MNFKHIQMIFIVTFIAVNLFLFKTYIDRITVVEVDTATFNLETELKKKNIQYVDILRNNDIPNDHIKLPYVTAPTSHTSVLSELVKLTEQSAVYDEKQALAKVTLDKPMQLSLDNGLTTADKETLQQFLDTKGYKGKEYHFLSYLPSKKEIVYTQAVNGIPVYEQAAMLTFTLNGSDVGTYYQDYTVGFTPENDSRALISAKEALTILYRSAALPDSSSIKTMQLVYQKSVKLEDVTVYAPVWYVVLETAENTQTSLRVDALTGVLLTAKINSTEKATDK